MQRHVYLSEICLALKFIIDEREHYLADVKEVKVCNYFYLLRNEVDIKHEAALENCNRNRKEEEIEEKHRVSADLIKQLDSTEEEFQKNLTMQSNDTQTVC